MVLCVFVCSFFTLRGEKRTYTGLTRWRGLGRLCLPKSTPFRRCRATLSPCTGEKNDSWRACSPPNLPADDDCVSPNTKRKIRGMRHPTFLTLNAQFSTHRVRLARKSITSILVTIPTTSPSLTTTAAGLRPNTLVSSSSDISGSIVAISWACRPAIV